MTFSNPTEIITKVSAKFFQSAERDRDSSRTADMLKRLTLFCTEIIIYMFEFFTPTTCDAIWVCLFIIFTTKKNVFTNYYFFIKTTETLSKSFYRKWK